MTLNARSSYRSLRLVWLVATATCCASIQAQQDEVWRIHDLQGASHVSPWAGREVRGVVGVVTSIEGPLFTIQSRESDADDEVSTSEGLHVDLGGTDGAVPELRTGDLVRLDGRVAERARRDSELSTTTLLATRLVVLATDEPLPAPVVLGRAGRRLPDRVITDDVRGGRVDGVTPFDPDEDALDLFESLEGMRVRVDEARVVGATNRFGVLFVVADDGAHASGVNARGGLTIAADDFNPERIAVELVGDRMPSFDLGARVQAPIVGVVGYAYGTYRVRVASMPAARRSALAPERAPRPPPGALTVASYNVENLSARSEPERFTAIARHIVEHLHAPDIVGLQEIQDDSGPESDGVVSGMQTGTRLVEAIRAAGGPHYTYAEVAPDDGADGGQPGGNIRCAVLVRADDGVVLVARDAPGDSARSVRVERSREGPGLAVNPARLGSDAAAFERSRKPLVVELDARGRGVFLVVNHFRSKGGDTPLFGAVQPPERASEAPRVEQARLVRTFVDEVLAIDPAAAVIVLGDMNDFAFSEPLRALAGETLVNLTERLAPTERYSYVYEGNSQALDHVLVSPALAARQLVYDVVHLNAEFAEHASDHDPCLLTIPGWDE